jgi:Fe-S oxidoreductase
MERYVKELEYCTYCPKMCRHACLVSNALGSETLIPQAKMELLNMLRRRAIPWERDYVVPLHGCASCRLCQQYCVHGNDVAAALQRGRVHGEGLGLVHPALSRLPEQFRDRSKLLMEKLHDEFSAHLFAAEAQVGYLPGADTVDFYIDDVRDALSVFDLLKLNFIRLVDGPHACPGYALWESGHHDAARFVAREVVESIRRYATVVVGDPAAAWLLREKLPAEGFDHNTEILHLSEYLYVHTERLEIRRTRPAALYQDPCYLGRYLGVYDPPRRLLARCVESVKEFFYNRQEAECCGGGGLIPHTFPEAALGQARRRLQEPALFDVPLVVTCCATCKRTFDEADTGVEVMDLVNLLAWCLHDPDRPRLPFERQR